MESHALQERINEAAGRKVLRANLGMHLSTIYEWEQDPGNARFAGAPRSKGPLDIVRIFVHTLAGTNTDAARLAIKHIELFVVRLCRAALERLPRPVLSKAEVIALTLKATREVTDTIEECTREGWTPAERCHRDRLTAEALEARDALDQLIDILDNDDVTEVVRFPPRLRAERNSPPQAS